VRPERQRELGVDEIWVLRAGEPIHWRIDRELSRQME
jgi:hypothetical protein